MNVHGLASGAIGVVNPPQKVGVFISVGNVRYPDGSTLPAYATPGAFVGSIAGTVLTVSAISAGMIQVGQALADESGNLLSGTVITGMLGGAGGTGAYSVNQAQSVGLEAMTTSLVMTADVQPTSFRDLQQLDGLNLGGIRWKTYLSGEVDAIVRPESKGGDLIVISSGRHQGNWLVAQILEQWPDWVCAAITLQNNEPKAPPPSPPTIDAYANEQQTAVYITDGGGAIIATEPGSS